MSAEIKVLYQFGKFRCDPREHLLLCDGRPVSLSPKSFEILIVLIQARPDWRRSITRLEEPAATTAFKQKMATEEAKQIYAQRSQIAEFPHAWIKERCGLRQFRCRGRMKVAMEAIWACLSYNLTRWFGLKRTLQVQPA